MARAAAGATSITVDSSFDAPGLMKIGTDLVTVSGAAGTGQTWTVSPGFSTSHHAGAYIVEVTIRVMMNGQDQSAVAQNLKHRESAPEGELEASWDIFTRDPGTYTPNLDGAEPIPFVLLANDLGGWTPFFGGFMGRVEDSQYPNGRHKLHLVGRGAYVTLGWKPIIVSQTWTADTAGHTMVEEAMATNAPYVSASHEHILDGGLAIGVPKDGYNSTVRQLVDFVVQRGDADGAPLDWFVRTDTDGGNKMWLLLRSREPIIDIPISSLKMPVTMVKDVEHRKTSVSIKWRDGYVLAPLTAGAGFVRGIARDYSSQIDNAELAQQVANAIYQQLSVVEAISDGQVVVEWPKPIGSAVHPLRTRAGWKANFTGWSGGLALTPVQIKSVDIDHAHHKLAIGVGTITEDDLDIGAQFFNKQTRILGTAASGLVPNNVAPPEGVPYQVQSNAASFGSGGNFGWKKVAPDADVISPVYMIDAGHQDDGTPNVITAGLKKPFFQIGVGGRIVGFKLMGDDGVADTPGPGTISIKVTRGHIADAPAPGTEVATIGIAADVTGSKDLVEPTATPAVGQIITATPSDYLAFEVLDEPPVDAMNNVAIMILIQRTEGSMRVGEEGGPAILEQTVGTDSLTRQRLFTVTTDRDCHIQIEYGQTTSYGSKSLTSELLGKTRQLATPPIATPFHWRVIATDANNHTTTGTDQSG